jgi:Domain of unknown function (DUF4365)
MESPFISSSESVGECRSRSRLLPFCNEFLERPLCGDVSVRNIERDNNCARYSPSVVNGSPKQKERFSRAWVVAAAAAADFTYEIVADDERGVDMTVHSHDHTLDFQLKATSRPEVQDECLVHDLDVRTYNLLRSQQRSGYGVLALIVVADDTAAWHVMDQDGTSLTRSAYYLPLFGMPSTPNAATIRLKVPMANLLTPEAMRALMDAQAARWAG